VKPEVSIIIPTYNRAGIIEKSLNSLLLNNASTNSFEVILVDDGSTDTTFDIIKSLERTYTIPIVYILQDHKGPAVARNKGIAAAKGKIIIFLDDDIIVDHGFVEEHINGHNKYPGENVAVQGIIQWSEELKITPFMKFYEKKISDYAYLSDGTEVESIITHNVSFIKSFLDKYGGFDESFLYAASEDTDLTLRLRQYGLKVLLYKRAIGKHYQMISIREGCKREERIGKAYTILIKNHPYLKKVNLSYREFIRIKIEHLFLTCMYPLFVIVSAVGWRYPLNRYYRIKCYLAFLYGTRKKDTR
jgi:glycosyltransferase involved in cell wall biosynthesis